MLATSPGAEFLGLISMFIWERKFRRRLFTSSKEAYLRRSRAQQWQQRNVQKKREALAELLFFSRIKPIAFLTFSLPSPSPSSDLIYPFMNIFTDNNLLNSFLRVANGHMSNSFFFLQLAMRTKKHKKGFGHRVSRNTSKHKQILITVQYWKTGSSRQL